MKPKTVKKTEGKTKKEKSQPKRMRTFNSSQFELWQQKNKAMKASATDLTILKQQGIASRRQQNKSVLSQYNGSKGNTTKIVMKKKKKTTTTKSKAKLKKVNEQQFEKVKYKQSNSHSQIVFSNDETKRESSISNIQLKNVKHIQSISNYQYDSNLILRVSIKKQYIRKVEAATKIQKVFRGFMTRKILMKYIKDEQQRLKSRLAEHLNSDFEEMHQNQTNRTFVDKQGEYLLNRLFENRAIGDNNVNHTMKARVEEFQQSQSQQDQKIGQQINKKYPRRKQEVINFPSQNKNWIQRQRQNQSEQQQQQSEEEDEDEGADMIYKRQNPIYSQQQISHYLESSEDQCQQQLQDAYEPDIIFQTNQEYLQSRKSSLQNKNQAINKLSNKGIADLALVGNIDDRIRKQLRQSEGIQKIRSRSEQKEDDDQVKDQKLNKNLNIQDLQKITKYIKQNQKINIKNQDIFEIKNEQLTQKNAKKQQSKLDENIGTDKKQELEEAFQTIVVNFDEQETNKKQKQINQNIQQKEPKLIGKLNFLQRKKQQNQEKSHRSSQISNQRQKLQISPRRQVKYLDQQFLVSNQSSANSCKSNKSKNSIEQEQIIRLREQQCEKWDEVIRMVSQQIRKNEENNGQIVNFMKTIMEFSQKNKQLLGSTRSVNSQSEAFTTPTSMGAGLFKSIQPKEYFNEDKQLDSGQKSDQIKNQPSDQNSNGLKFFKKKKPLKIELSDQNIFEDQKDSISESKKQNNKFDFPRQKQFIRSKNKNIQFNQKSPIYKFHKNEPYNLEQKRIIKNELQNINQNSKTLKNFLTSNIQVQDDAINDILKLREELLQKRQSQQLTKLNKELGSNKLTQQQFLQKLTNMTRKFHEQKQMIDKAKQDIVKGYQAANDLVKQYFFDVRRMGIKMAVSRSQDNLKYKFTHPLNFNTQIKIDQLTPKSTPKSTPKGNQKRMSVKQIFASHEIYEQNKQKSSNHQNSYQQSSQDSIQFTQQQLKRFRKAANYDLQFNDLNRNMTTLSDQFIKQQKGFSQQNNIKQLNESPQFHRIIKDKQLHRQTYHLQQQQKIPLIRTPPHIQAIVQNQVNVLVWQFASQLLLRPMISDKFIDKSMIIRPVQITHEQRLQFIKILQQNLPDRTNLHRKLNQNITPLPSQILKCMRLDFSEDDPAQEYEQNDDQNYQQINKYQFVISQQACAKSVMLFKNQVDKCEQIKQIDQIRKKNQILSAYKQIIPNTGYQQKIQKFINQRQIFLKNRKQHTRQLRWEVINIQLHCIFDSWNQQIIQICSQRSGFSGIGLNQLTLSMINHNKPVLQQKCQNVIIQAKQKVIEILVDDTDLNAKVLRQNFHQMCQNDSAWIFYADQALSYALQLVYLIQEDIYTEVSRQIRKIIMKNSLTI